jgi:hypothetical protein
VSLPGLSVFSACCLDHVVVVMHGAGPLAKGLLKPSQQQQLHMQVETPITMLYFYSLRRPGVKCRPVFPLN